MKQKIYHFLPIMLCFFGLIFFSNVLFAESILIKNAWIREAPPNSKTMSAYLEIMNSSDNAFVLTSAKSDGFENIEFHLSEIKDSVARMHKQANIVIAPQTTFTFKPGSYHLMLFNNVLPMRAGQAVTIQFLFEDGTIHTVDVPIKRAN